MEVAAPFLWDRQDLPPACRDCRAVRRNMAECPLPEDAIDIRSVNWNRVWQARQGPLIRDAGFWGTRASSFAKAGAERHHYADRFLDILDPRPDWTVLDMGCGGGVLAVPLAKRVASVTAVDISKEMLAVVRARCAGDGIDNVRVLEGRWEDDWQELGLGTFDVAIASRSLVAEDLRSSILKLHRAARKRVCVVAFVGDGPYHRRLFEAIGRPLNAGPDYIYVYNMLYQTGFLAYAAFIGEPRNRTYGSHEEAFASVCWMFGRMSRVEEERLRNYLGAHLLPCEGRWRLPYDVVVWWAVMWWDKANSPVP